MKNYVFLGAPGVGKGTMSNKICSDEGYAHISTGDLLRAELKAGSELGTTAKEYMNAGKLVPDTLVADLLAQGLAKICAESEPPGFIFDGYPRTVPQAELLQGILEKQGLELTGVVQLDAAEAVVLPRLTGRRLCRACGAIFHLLFGKPKVDGVCDACGGELYQRGDDNEESVRQRLVEYNKQTMPLIDYYATRNLLIRLDAEGTPEENYVLLTAALKEWENR